MPIDLNAIVQKAWDVVGAKVPTALKSLTVLTGPSSIYDETSDTTITTWDQSTDATGILYDLSDNEIDGSGPEEMNAILAGRAKKLLLQGALFDQPPTTDSIVVIGMTTWQVKGVFPDPADPATYVLQLRR